GGRRGPRGWSGGSALEREVAVGAAGAGQEAGGLDGEDAVEAEGADAPAHPAPADEVPVVAVDEAGDGLDLADRDVGAGVAVAEAHDAVLGDGGGDHAGPVGGGAVRGAVEGGQGGVDAAAGGGGAGGGGAEGGGRE